MQKPAPLNARTTGQGWPTRPWRWAAAVLALAAAGAWVLNPAPPALPTAVLARPEPQHVQVDARPATEALSVSGSPARPSPEADVFLTEQLQQTFEDLLLEALASGDVRDGAVLRQRVSALVAKYFSPDLVQRATALLGRYVDYREALGQLAAPADPTDPDALRAAVQARQRVRQRYFSAEENEALFGQDERLDRYTLERLSLERQTDLTEAQKQAALTLAAQHLSDSQRAQRSAAVQHLDVQAQTATFERSNIASTERHAQRSALYGEQAAQRLGQLDAEERQWQASLDQFAQAASALDMPGAASTGAASQTSAAQRQQLEQLKQQLFTPEQQPRVEAGLALRALQASNPSKLPR